jgi:potassium-dependent mechanosensitive channel
MIVGFLCAQALADENALKSSSIGRALHGRFGLSDRQLDITAMAASLLTYGAVLFAGVPLILLQWGFKWGDLLHTARNFLTELKIGSVTISLTAIAVGILVFFLGYYLSGRFEKWLDKTVLSRARMDKGARTSIRTAVGYLGIALAALIGISVAGVQLSSLALVAGALSVGIGFGLQNIVSNFVSGLILLAERPFKEGDWIEAGPVNGIVKKVSVRATEIETFQKQSVILPNSSLINAAVGNWTHRNTLARLDVPVVVSYGADVVKVQNILRSIASAHPKIMKTPEPFVLFKGFGAERLEFELRFFIADLFEQAVIGTEVRFEIVKRFREDGVDLPYQQHDAMHSIFADDPDIGAVAEPPPPTIDAPVVVRKPAKG